VKSHFKLRYGILANTLGASLSPFSFFLFYLDSWKRPESEGTGKKVKQAISYSVSDPSFLLTVIQMAPSVNSDYGLGSPIFDRR
jgi:hypothetical protein